MSLFQAREWWFYNPDEDSNLPPDFPTSVSLAMDSFFGITGSHSDVIVTASLTGVLRVFSPFIDTVQNPDGNQSWSPANLLLETQLAEPILQVKIGKLTSSNNGDPKLLVLHPRLVSVYTIQVQKGKSHESDGFQLNLQYQHKLSRSAFSSVVGNFGNGKKDFICVQSLDGAINFFEQESFSFSRFLPGFLLPGPIVYNERTDSFITVSSAYQLESYRYHTLAVSGDQPRSQKNDEITTGRKLTPDWQLSLGEEATNLQIIVSDKKDIPSIIIFTGSRSICAVYDTGVVVFMKKLDYTPICSLAYKSDWNESKIMILVASENQTLLIYENLSLKWAAQLPFNPISIKRGSFKKTDETNDLHQNMLVLTSKKGEIYISYLGTDPTLFTVPTPLARDVNYEETDKEMEVLSSKIKAAAQTNDNSVPQSTKPVGDINVTTEVSSNLERCYYKTLVNFDDSQSYALMCKIQVRMKCQAPLSNIRVTFSTNTPLTLSHKTHTIQSLTDSAYVDTYAYMNSNSIPYNLDCLITVTYLTNQGSPKVVTTSVKLPLKLVLNPCPPIKDADYKVTISTNKPAVSLLDLFPEFVLDSTLANAVGFQYLVGYFVTVLSSKTSQRYRLQSDNLPSLWLLTEEIEERLKKHFNSDPASKDEPLRCTYASSLPMHEYFTEIEMHYHKRDKMKTLRTQLSQRTTQFRTIEKRLLTLFKDKTPSPLTNLDTLLEGTFRQIVIVAEAIDECEQELINSACNISCITKLILLLLRLSTGLNYEEIEKLEYALTSVIHHGQEQGWEETTDAALTFLLRTSLAKPGKENQGATPITLEPSKDTSRLKKHISSIIDRISKGAKIKDFKQIPSEGSSLMDFHEITATDPEDILKKDETLPIGSQFGEAGERQKSAAKSRSRPGSSISMIIKQKDQEDVQAALAKLSEDYKDVEKDIIDDPNENEIDENADVDDLIGW